MWEILKTKVKELPTDWIKGAILFFLGMSCVYYFLSYRAAVIQANIVIAQLQNQILGQMDALNGQCQGLLERQGYVINKPEPQPPPSAEEEKDDAGEKD